MPEIDEIFEKTVRISKRKMKETEKYNKKRFLYDKLLKIAKKEENFTVLLTGMRGVGKTVLSLQIGKKLEEKERKTIYIPADHISLSEVTLYELVEHGTKHGYENFIIDEVHSRPNWSKELKSIHDSLNVFVLATGSSTTLMKEGKYDLSRRAMEIQLPIISYREMINLRFNENRKQATLEEITGNFQDLAAEHESYSMKDYLSYYSLPISLEHPPEIGKKLLVSSLEKMIYRDLPEVYNLDTDTLYDAKKILSYLASTTPGKTSITNISQRLENIGKGTVKRILTAFSQLGLITLIPPHGKGGRKLRKSYKVLLTPPYRYIIAEATGTTPEKGSLREDFFITHCSHQHEVEYLDKKGAPDYIVDEEKIFEVGGPKKSRKQLNEEKESYLVADTDYSETKIPLHLFGYLY